MCSSHGSAATAIPISSNTPRRPTRPSTVGGRRRLVVAAAGEAPQRAARVAVDVGTDRGADRPAGRRATAGRRRTRATSPSVATGEPRSHVRRTSIRSSRVSLRPDHHPVVGLGHRRQHVGLADLPPRRRGDDVGEVARQRRQPPAGLGDEVQHARARRARRRASRAPPRRARPVAAHGWRAHRRGRRRAALRARPTWRSAPAPDRRDRCASGLPASGRARPDLPSSAPRARRASGRGRRGRGRPPHRDGRRCRCPSRVGRSPPRSGRRRRGRRAEPGRPGGHGRRSTPRPRPGGRPPARRRGSTAAAAPAACLQGDLRLGHVHRHADLDVVDRGLVRLGARTPAATPQRPLVGTGRRPARRRRRAVRRRRPSCGVRRDRDDLFDGPPARFVDSSAHTVKVPIRCGTRQRQSAQMP